MMKFNKFFIGAILAITALTSCHKKSPEPMVGSPGFSSAYDVTDFAKNTADVTLPTKIAALKAKASEGANVDGTKVTVADLKALFDFKGDVSAHFNDMLVGMFMTQIEEASGNAYTIEDIKTKKEKGGAVLKGEKDGKKEYRLLDETGIEYIQLLEKGLYGAALYNKAASLLKTDMTPADLDKVVRLFGSKDGKFDIKDGNEYLAKYAVKSSSETEGLFFDMRDACRLLQVRIQEGKDAATKEKDIKNIRTIWEKALAARSIYYFKSAIKVFSETSSSDKDKANALHAYSEGIGFMIGLIGVDGAITTKPQVKKFANTAFVNFHGDGVTCHKLITDPIESVKKLSEAIEQLKTIYGFNEADMTMFSPK